jgi:sec-independent protein translocase protein TatB
MGTPPQVLVANIGMADSIILMILALVVFGPRRLPQIGRQVGKLMYEFRKASNDFKFQMEEELRQSEEADRRKKQEEERQRALAAAPPAPQIEATTAVAETTPAEATAETTPTESAPALDISNMSPDEYEPASAVPRILPPTTGEKVAAERPGPYTDDEQIVTNEPASPAANDAKNESGEAQASATPEDERSEPAAHHG